MLFTKVSGTGGWDNVPLGGAFLVTDKWDDFGFRTSFTLWYKTLEGAHQTVGMVKIGHNKQTVGGVHAAVNDRFDALPDGYFSLGQSDEYYSYLNSIGDDVRLRILKGLRDLAADDKLFKSVRHLNVVSTSLMRSVSETSVTGQFRRLAMGGARLTDFSFAYQSASTPDIESGRLDFNVTAESSPPTNVHVLIGSNGVGKTSLLQSMARSLTSKPDDQAWGVFHWNVPNANQGFANLVTISFSAFDDFSPELVPPAPPEPIQTSEIDSGLKCTNVGLRSFVSNDKTSWPTGAVSVEGQNETVLSAPKDSLSKQFEDSRSAIRRTGRLERWMRALEILATDPIFDDVVNAFRNQDRKNPASGPEEDVDNTQQAYENGAFNQLSSGHKSVLLTVTRLVELVEERSLVLLDEPETHLHPPLLSAFVRALSDLMTNRNAVAVIATHSPVVLQEVPSHCVWILKRSGGVHVAERPTIQTFGENVGVLTREAFGLEVTRSGFYRLLSEAVEELKDFDKVVDRFDGRLAHGALALIQALVAEFNQGVGK